MHGHVPFSEGRQYIYTLKQTKMKKANKVARIM